MNQDDMALVREFAATRCETAFTSVVERYVGLVHSAALRQTGDAHLAEEITQAVFIILARKAPSLGRDTILPAWLYRATRYAAMDALKSQGRRREREQEAYMQSTLQSDDMTSAWQQLAPALDEAMADLRERDRAALVLHYFENRGWRDVAATLQVTEDAAQKRVKRAIEKLRLLLAKRGVTLGVTVIAGAVLANAVNAAPVGLAAKTAAVAGKGLATTTSTAALVKGAWKLMAGTKAKTALVAGLCGLLASGTMTVLIEKHNNAKQYVVAHEPWSDAGSATPRAALQSLAWALTQDKFDRAQELMQWDEKGLAYAGDAKMRQQLVLMSVLAPALKDIESFRILSIVPTKQPNELMVKIEKTFKDGNIRPFAVTAKLRRAGNQCRAVGNLEYFENGSESMRLPFTGSF